MGAKEVAAGAAWLDKNFPGWERKIDLGKLRIICCENCITGQALRDFVTGKYENGWHYANDVLDTQLRDKVIEYETWQAVTVSTCNPENEPLWRELIKERFSTGTLSDG